MKLNALLGYSYIINKEMALYSISLLQLQSVNTLILLLLRKQHVVTIKIILELF